MQLLQNAQTSALRATNALSGVDNFEDENSIPALSVCALARVIFFEMLDLFDSA